MFLLYEVGRWSARSVCTIPDIYFGSKERRGPRLWWGELSPQYNTIDNQKQSSKRKVGPAIVIYIHFELNLNFCSEVPAKCFLLRLSHPNSEPMENWNKLDLLAAWAAECPAPFITSRHRTLLVKTLTRGRMKHKQQRLLGAAWRPGDAAELWDSHPPPAHQKRLHHPVSRLETRSARIIKAAPRVLRVHNKLPTPRQFAGATQCPLSGCPLHTTPSHTNIRSYEWAKS